jgi:hypothetical protein
MDGDYQLLLDVWEADVDLDVPTLLEKGVAGLICRLNDMEGGHHMDAQFPKLWAQAQQFPTQEIYFVYNPWVDGATNYNWLAGHLPAGYQGRILHDIEVKYSGYSPAVYAANVAQFDNLCRPRWAQANYTCQGFLPTLSSWPVDVDYWWAAYPNVLNTGEHINWDDLRNRLKTLTYAYNGAACPGGKANVKMWQCSGGGVWLPGFGTHAVDINVFPGTLDHLKVWMGKAPAPVIIVNPPVTIEQRVSVIEQKIAAHGW